MSTKLINKKKEKFSKVVLQNLTALKQFAFSLCKNDFDADDLVSDTILKAFESFHRIRDLKKTKQWLFRILLNRFISNYRKRKQFIEINLIQERGTDSSFSLFEEISRSTFTEEGNPEIKFISKLTKNTIDNAIGNLPIEFQTAITLCDKEEFTYAEIATITSTNIGTVRSRIARGRKLLQKQLWYHAQELGIKKSKAIIPKSEYTCTCGKEEEEKKSLINQ